MTVSALITFAAFGTLCNVDPLGIGGLTRLIKFDPASLSNITLLIALMISAVGDCLYETAKIDAIAGNQTLTDIPEFAGMLLFYSSFYSPFFRLSGIHHSGVDPSISSFTLLGCDEFFRRSWRSTLREDQKTERNLKPNFEHFPSFTSN